MEDQFIFTMAEFAKLHNLQTESVRTRIRRGQLDGQYIKKDGKYFFKRGGPITVATGNKDSSLAPRTASRSRGSHKKMLLHEGTTKYKSYSHQKNNEAKMLASLKYKVDKETQDVLPEAIEIAKKMKEERIKKTLASSRASPTKYYGGMLHGHQPPLIKNSAKWRAVFPEVPDEYQKYLEDNDLIGKPTKTYY